MRLTILLLAGFLVTGCGSKTETETETKTKTKKGTPKQAASQWTKPSGPNRLTKMTDQAACEAFFVKLGECADFIEAEAVRLEPRQGRGLAAEIRQQAKMSRGVCRKQASILRKRKHSPYVCFPWPRCGPFAKCITEVGKASLQERKRRLNERRRKMLKQGEKYKPGR